MPATVLGCVCGGGGGGGMGGLSICLFVACPLMQSMRGCCKTKTTTSGSNLDMHI